MTDTSQYVPSASATWPDPTASQSPLTPAADVPSAGDATTAAASALFAGATITVVLQLQPAPDGAGARGRLVTVAVRSDQDPPIVEADGWYRDCADLPRLVGPALDRLLTELPARRAARTAARPRSQPTPASAAPAAGAAAGTPARAADRDAAANPPTAAPGRSDRERLDLWNQRVTSRATAPVAPSTGADQALSAASPSPATEERGKAAPGAPPLTLPEPIATSVQPARSEPDASHARWQHGAEIGADADAPAPEAQEPTRDAFDDMDEVGDLDDLDNLDDLDDLEVPPDLV